VNLISICCKLAFVGLLLVVPPVAAGWLVRAAGRASTGPHARLRRHQLSRRHGLGRSANADTHVPPHKLPGWSIRPRFPQPQQAYRADAHALRYDAECPPGGANRSQPVACSVSIDRQHAGVTSGSVVRRPIGGGVHTAEKGADSTSRRQRCAAVRASTAGPRLLATREDRRGNERAARLNEGHGETIRAQPS